MAKRWLWGLLVAALALCARGVEARPKTDVVMLKNGDRITCEIKLLTRGKLTVKTDGMGTLDIEWLDIVALESSFYFRVESADGRRFYGTLKLYDDDDEMRIGSQRTMITVPKHTVVELEPIERTFWSRIDGSFGIGFSFTKASQVAQLTLDWLAKYHAERNFYDAKVNVIVTDKGNEEETARRADLSLTYNRLLRGRWTGSLSGALQRNDELNIRRRFIGSIGTGVNPLESSRQHSFLSVGLALNSELSADSSATTESLEAVFTATYSYYIYNTPKRDISTTLDVYPSLTESGRYRARFDAAVRFEIIMNLFFDVTYYLDYDNKPPGGGEKDDYGIVTSVEWTY